MSAPAGVAAASPTALVSAGTNAGNTNGASQAIFTALTGPGFGFANVSRASGLVGSDGGDGPGTTTAPVLDFSELVNVGGQSSAGLALDGMAISLDNLTDQPTAAQDRAFTGLGEGIPGRTISLWNQDQSATMVLSNAAIPEQVNPPGLDNLFSSWGQGDEVSFWLEV